MSNLGYYANAGSLPKVLLPSEIAQNDQVLADLLRRCPQATLDAARRYRITRSHNEVPAIIQGIIGRYIEKDKRDLLSTGQDSLALIGDLGLDSLSMIEISMTLEDVLEIALPDEKLREFQTLGDIKVFARNSLGA
jgi:acyl carrier protein